MGPFLASLGAFILLHSLPALPPVRARLIGALGRTAYLALYSLVSTAVIVLVFRTAFSLDYIPLWDAAPWQADVTLALAPAGLFLVIAGLLGRNPFSVTLRPDGARMDAIVHITRHPVPLGFALWSFGHVVPNGDLRSLILFGILGLFSLGGIAMQEKRARRRLGSRFEALSAETSILPLAAVLRGRAGFRPDASLLLSLAITAALTAAILGGLHAALIGADPLALAAG